MDLSIILIQTRKIRPCPSDFQIRLFSEIQQFDQFMVILKTLIVWQFTRLLILLLLVIMTVMFAAGMLLLAKETCTLEKATVRKLLHWPMIISTEWFLLDSTINLEFHHWRKYTVKGRVSTSTKLWNHKMSWNLKKWLNFYSEKNLDAHEVDLKDQPIGLGLQGQSNPIVITPTSVITVNVSFLKNISNANGRFREQKLMPKLWVLNRLQWMQRMIWFVLGPKIKKDVSFILNLVLVSPKNKSLISTIQLLQSNSGLFMIKAVHFILICR